MDVSLELIQENLEKDHVRKRTFIDMYKQVREQSKDFPFTCVTALEHLVTKLLDNDPIQPVVALEADFSTDINPNATYESYGKMTSRFQFYFLGQDIHLGTYLAADVDGRKMHVGATLKNLTDLTIHHSIDGVVDRTFQLELSELINCGFIKASRLDSLKAVGLKKATSKGKIHFKSKQYAFGMEYANKYIFVFLDKGEFYFFDEQAEEVIPSTTGLIDQVLSGKHARINKVKREIKMFDAYLNSAKAGKGLRKRWFSEPNSFSKDGIRILLSGKKSARTNCDGNLDFRHYVGGKPIPDFYVDQNLKPTDVDLYWCGPNVLVLDKLGRALNAHILATPGIETMKVPYIPDLEQAIALIPLNNIALPRITVNSNIYCFSTKKIKEFLKPFPTYCPKALYASVYQAPFDPSIRRLRSNFSGQNSFMLLVNYDGGNYTFPISSINHICRKTS